MENEGGLSVDSGTLFNRIFLLIQTILAWSEMVVVSYREMARYLEHILEKQSKWDLLMDYLYRMREKRTVNVESKILRN